MIRSITPDMPLKVLGFTDTHLDDYPGCFRTTVKLMRETIAAEKPDMVVFVGDNVTGGDNRERAYELTHLMTGLNVPWAPVLGNHEGDNPASVRREDMLRIFMESPCCLLKDVAARLDDGSPVWGFGNYSVPLYDISGIMCHRLVFMDGGSDMNREDMIRFGWGDREKPFDDYLKPSQIAWYAQTVRNDKCTSTVFCHIPLPEFSEAEKNGELLSGRNMESVCCSPHNSGMFAEMLQHGKTKVFVAGHDHINTARYLYKGIRLAYNRMSGLSSYNVVSKQLADKLLQGCSVYRIHADGMVDFDDVVYEDRFPQFRDEIYAVIRTPDKPST